MSASSVVGWNWSWQAFYSDRRRNVHLLARAAAGVGIAGGVFAGGLVAARDADWGGASRSRAAFDATAAREARAEHLLAGTAARVGLPARREKSKRSGDALADLALQMTGHAEANGVRLHLLERVEADGGHDRAGSKWADAHLFKLSVEGDFTALHRFVAGLAALPVLVVPVASSVTRNGAAGSMDVSLRVFASLPGGAAWPPPTAGGRPAELSRADPFGGEGITPALEQPDARLVGIFRDRRNGLALFEAAAQAWSVGPGQTVFGSRVARIDLGGVTLSTHGAVRRVAVVEGSAR